MPKDEPTAVTQEDVDRANAAFDIAFRGETDGIDDAMASLFTECRLAAEAKARIVPEAGMVEALEAAAKAVLNACYLADANEELSGHVDGSLLDALSDALDWRCPEIWTQEQVDGLNACQGGYGHPFTCGGERGDEAHTAYAEENGEDKGQLIATKRGWVCPVCDYRQFWAHDNMFKGARPNPLERLRSLPSGPDDGAGRG